MKNRWIKPGFKVPKGYCRQFFFEDRDAGFKMRMMVTEKGILAEQQNSEAMRSEFCLDWIGECLESVRVELGA